jgi:hypothetical protein
MNETLEQIAEDYVYRNRPLTREERNLLKESKYSILLKDDKTPIFNALLEAAEPEEKASPRVTVGHKPYSDFHPEVDALIIKDLIRALKKRYNLGIENFDIHQFTKPNYDEVKTFIRNEFVPKRTEPGSITRRAIVKALNCNNFEDCWHSLCYAGQGIRRPVY